MVNKVYDITCKTTLIDEPAGFVDGGFQYVMKLAGVVVGDPVVVPNETTPAVFTITAPGTYTWDASRIAKTGEAAAPAVTSAPEQVMPDQLAVPLTVVVTLQPAPTVAVPVAVTVTPTP